MQPTYHTTLGRNGRIVIPFEIREALSLGSDDPLVISVVDGEVRIKSVDHAVHRIQDRMRRFIAPGISIVDELISERRAAAVRENSDEPNA